jgi:uncharacterized membrane protein YkvA (DUF1232 family)
VTGLIARAKAAIRRLEAETFALYLALRDPRTPWYARAWCIFVIAHTLSPIDLIPDFIPVLGYLDDLVLIPLGIALALRMIPPEVMADSRAKAQEAMGQDRRLGKVAAAVIVTVWLLAIGLTAFLLVRAL